MSAAQSRREAPVVVAAHEALADKARRIAGRFSLRFAARDGELPRFVLLLTDRQLELRDTLGVLGKGFCVDFTAANSRGLARRGVRSNEALGRALGLKKSANPSVLDATAGIGRDAFVLAALGCSVTMCERSPALAALLQDGLERAYQDQEFVRRIGDRLTLWAGDSIELLRELSETGRPQMIYIDPMYPHRGRSAQVKKEMQYLRALVGQDCDSATLLAAALESATRRVVVKRRKADPSLSGIAPNHSVLAGQVRFDVYLRNDTTVL